MPIVHHPFDFSLGPVNFTGFGIAMMLAFGVAHWVSQVVLTGRGDDPNVMNDVTFAALVGTIVGAVACLILVVRIGDLGSQAAWERLKQPAASMAPLGR